MKKTNKRNEERRKERKKERKKERRRRKKERKKERKKRRREKRKKTSFIPTCYLALSVHAGTGTLQKRAEKDQKKSGIVI